MVGKWLLCDFHIHTTFSDGALTIREVIDLYGHHGFDAISITDHILDSNSYQKNIDQKKDPKVITKRNFHDYLQTLWAERQRAWEEYNMLVIPGTEITNNHSGYHILGIDIKDYISPDLSVEEIVIHIHNQGGVAIAPHPHRGSITGTMELMHLWDNHKKYIHLFDAWEVANRDDLFNVIGLKKFNYIANSDFHEKKHLFSWKTLLRCEKNTEAIKAEIRKNNGVSIYLFREGKQFKGKTPVKV